MQNQLTTALIQSPLVWEDAEANRNFFREKIDAISQSVDLIVLPEMFSTGFTMSPQNVAETMNGKTVKWMKSVAVEKNCAITGSLVIKSGANVYNRLLFVFPDGEIKQYDKRHLFSLAGEHVAFTAGKKRLLVEYKGFRICPLICYDLRFPAFSRNTEYYDLLIYVANWPLPRIAAWDALLKARAIENMSYVVGVNRTGTDPNGLEYPGHSQVLDFMGEYLVSAWENEGIFVATLEKNPMLEVRKKFSFLEDRDSITVK
ncbi:MAG: amidohydrolase [Flavobacterium sp.]|uniref:amidohydrolase n=1 Tax=Flavobacterium sp. TaxID=239 RepID=UPI001206D746|nr:amidohydrolase [Flavobacterium sp.]RZJ68032.1 MAG: amidohydrolase [Flavobacterium sp.]